MIPPNNSLFVGGDTVERMTATLLSALLISRSYYINFCIFMSGFKLGLVQSLKLSSITLLVTYCITSQRNLQYSFNKKHS